MRSVLAVVVLLLISSFLSAEASTCHKTSCALLGQNCNVLTKCADNLNCIKGTCQTDNVGATCKTAGDCFTPAWGAPATCVNGKCKQQYLPGDTCRTNSDCLSGSCSGSMCQGIAEKGSCNPMQNKFCGANLYCNSTSNGVCAKTLGQGKKCSPDAGSLTAPCGPGYICQRESCVQIFSLDAGATCDFNETCAMGLGCVNNTCSHLTPFTVQSCQNSSQCSPHSGGCTCQDYNGISYCLPTSSQDANGVLPYDTLLNCLVQNDCSLYSLDIASPQSCSYTFCFREFINYHTFDCSINNQLNGYCVFNPLC